MLQWALLAYAIFSSTSLIIVNVAKSFGEVGKGKKLVVIILICIFQIIIFFVLKLYFFKHLNKELLDEKVPDTTIITNIIEANNNQTNTKNNTRY